MLSLALTLCVLTPVQDPKPAPPAVKTWTDREARDAVKSFQKAFKKKRASLRDRLQALEPLTKGSNKKLVAPLASVVQTGKSKEVRKQAAAALGNQPARAATKTLLKLLGDSKLNAVPVVQAELVMSLSRCGYDRRHWKQIEKLFEKEYDLKRVPLQKALLELITEHKEKGAVDILLRNLDEPVPANVDAPDNPPKEYWEARWKSWQIWRPQVKTALYALTGQKFSTAKEAKQWIKKNGAKIGL